MPTIPVASPQTLRIGVFHERATTRALLAHWLEAEGHLAWFAQISAMPDASQEAAAFIGAHRCEVVVFDVGVPYLPNWDFGAVLPRLLPAPIPFIYTSANTGQLAIEVGPTNAFQFDGTAENLFALLTRIRGAAGGDRSRSQYQSRSQLSPLGRSRHEPPLDQSQFVVRRVEDRKHRERFSLTFVGSKPLRSFLGRPGRQLNELTEAEVRLELSLLNQSHRTADRCLFHARAAHGLVPSMGGHATPVSAVGTARRVTTTAKPVHGDAHPVSSDHAKKHPVPQAR